MQGPLGGSPHRPPRLRARCSRPILFTQRTCPQDARPASPPWAASVPANPPVALTAASDKVCRIESYSVLNYAIQSESTRSVLA